MATPYTRAKVSALRREPNFDYFIQPGYDRVPTEGVYNGFGAAFDNHVLDNVPGGGPKNMPPLMSDLGPYQTMGAFDGFHRWSDARASIDVAPLLMNVRMPQTDLISSSLRGMSQNAPVQLLHNGVQVAEVPMQHDAGNPVGILYGPPADPTQRRSGRLTHVPPAFSTY